MSPVDGWHDSHADATPSTSQEHIEEGCAGLLVMKDWKPLTSVLHPAAISPGSCTKEHTSAENTRQDRFVDLLVLGPPVGTASRWLAVVVFKLDNCFTRLPCGLLWGPVTGKRIFHTGRSKLDSEVRGDVARSKCPL